VLLGAEGVEIIFAGTEVLLG